MEQIPDQNKDKEKENIENKAFSTKEELTFDEFTSKRLNRMNMYNNFVAYFIQEGIGSEMLRGQDFFVRFQDENKELEESLTKRISKWREDTTLPQPPLPEDILEDLYEAYKIMITYDKVKTSNDLFR